MRLNNGQERNSFHTVHSVRHRSGPGQDTEGDVFYNKMFEPLVTPREPLGNQGPLPGADRRSRLVNTQAWQSQYYAEQGRGTIGKEDTKWLF